MSTETKVVEVFHSFLHVLKGLHRDELVKTKQNKIKQQLIKSVNNSKRLRESN